MFADDFAMALSVSPHRAWGHVYAIAGHEGRFTWRTQSASKRDKELEPETMDEEQAFDEIVLERHDVESLQQYLSRQRLPAIATGVVGFGGAQYELYVRVGFSRICWEWNLEMPPELSTLGPVVAYIRQPSAMTLKALEVS